MKRPKGISKTLRDILPVLLVLMMATSLVYVKFYPNLDEARLRGKEFRQLSAEDVEGSDLPSGLEVDESTGGSLEGTELIPSPVKDKIAPGNTNETGKTTYTGEEKTRLGLLNTMILLALAVIGGFFIYLMFKHRKRLSLKIFFGSAMALICVSTLFYFGWWVYYLILNATGSEGNLTWAITVLSLFSVPYGILLSHMLISNKTSPLQRNIAMLSVGGMMGAFLASLLPIFIILPFVFFIALYDIYAVKRGLIKKIMDIADEDSNAKRQSHPGSEKETSGETGSHSTTVSPSTLEASQNVSPTSKDMKTAPLSATGCDKMTAKTCEVPVGPTDASSGCFNGSSDSFDPQVILMYDTKEWSLGLGDLVFYSMFCAAGVRYISLMLPYYQFYSSVLGTFFPWLMFLILSLAVLLGFVLSLRMLERTSLLPGLPMSIFLGLGTFLGTLLVMETVNFMMSGKWAPVF